VDGLQALIVFMLLSTKMSRFQRKTLAAQGLLATCIILDFCTKGIVNDAVALHPVIVERPL
jgi:hypothetical protein